MFISEKGCLLRKAVSGEHYLLLVFFMEESGLKYALVRAPKGKGTDGTIPDLFETGTVILEQRDPAKPAFLKDFNLDCRFDGIARSYRSLKAASELARFYERNLVHMEHYNEAWTLLQRAMESLSTRELPEATLLKTYFVFARSEGYPVIAHWLKRKKSTERTAITEALRSPLEQVQASSIELDGWISDLGDFFQRETDLLPGEPATKG